MFQQSGFVMEEKKVGKWLAEFTQKRREEVMLPVETQVSNKHSHQQQEEEEEEKESKWSSVKVMKRF